MPYNAQVVEFEPKGEPWEFENDWDHNMCDCCYKCSRCCCAFFCLPCLMYKTMRRGGETCCGALCWGYMPVFRTKLRTALRIKGSIISDWCALVFCGPCAIMQMSLELDKFDEPDKPSRSNRKNQQRSRF